MPASRGSSFRALRVEATTRLLSFYQNRLTVWKICIINIGTVAPKNAPVSALFEYFSKLRLNSPLLLNKLKPKLCGSCMLNFLIGSLFQGSEVVNFPGQSQQFLSSRLTCQLALARANFYLCSFWPLYQRPLSCTQLLSHCLRYSL